MSQETKVISIMLFMLMTVTASSIDIPLQDPSIPKVVINVSTTTLSNLLSSNNVWTGTNNFTILTYFYGALNLGTTADETPGNMRYTSNQFQGYNGTDWVALSGTGGADTTCDSVVCSLGDDTDYRFTALDFTSTTGMSDLVDNDTWPGVASNYYTSSEVDGLLDDKLDITDQRYNDTALIGTINNLSNSSIASLMGNTTIARVGDCPNGQVVQNTTTGGVQCVLMETGSVYYPTALNLTAAKYTGNFTFSSDLGYKAGNSICNNEYVGSHFCSQEEILLFFKKSNNNPLLDGADVWTSTGSPKYIPADVPINDCQGWTYNGTVTSLGNYWHYNTTTNGEGRAINCLTKFYLGCCSY